MSLTVQKTIERLSAYNDSPFPILSVYLNLKKFPYEEFVQLYRSLPLNQKNMLKNDKMYIESFLQNNAQRFLYNSLAIFSGNDQLWEIIQVPFPLKPQISVGYKPYLQPLMHTIPRFQLYLIVLADRAKAKFFTIHMGNLEAIGEVTDKSPSQNINAPDQTCYGRSDKINRHIQQHLHRHFQSLSRVLDEFIQNKPISGVILAGHKQFLPQFERNLSKPLQHKIIGGFTSELNISMSKLLSKANAFLGKSSTSYLLPISHF